GLHPSLPENAVALGADLVVSSTHKGSGSLTQTAVLHLGHGEHARRIEALVDRVVRSYQSTSSSALLLASIDEARRFIVTNPDVVEHAHEAASALRHLVRQDRRYRDATPDIMASPGTIAVDPFKIAIDTRGAGITGGEAQHLLIRDHRIYCELSTPSAL